MRRFLIVTICTLFTVSSTFNVYALGPQLEVDCGNWNYLKDSKGSYRELSATATYGFAGSNFTYSVNFFGSQKENFSRGSFEGTYKIENPEYSVHQIELPINMKFRNSSKEKKMFQSNYIRGEFLFTDAQGFEARKICIWKWKKQKLK